MIFITGDCHCNFKKFNRRNFPEQKILGKNDYVIVCGDFGIWDQSKEQEYWNRWFEDKTYTTLFCDGNHDNFDLLNKYEIETWYGGKVHRINNKLIHLMRGQVYEIEGIKLFSFGGAYSHDISDGLIEIDNEGKWKKLVKKRDQLGLMQRVNHLEWWKEEVPSQREFEEALMNLKKHDYKVNIVVSHCGPSSIVKDYGIDSCTEYLEEIRKKIQFDKWYFGHYHTDKEIDKNYEIVYEHIIKYERS